MGENPLRRKRSASREKIPVVQEKQPKTDENPFENSYEVPDIEENGSIETSVKTNGTTSREAEPPKATTKITDLISEPDVRKSVSPKKPAVSRKPSVASIASRRPSSRALEDTEMDDLDELLLGDEVDEVDLGGDIDDEDLFA